MSLPTKESIKNIILSGGKIEVSYKSQINDWYGQLSIHSHEGFFIVHPRYIKFSDIDECVNYFCMEAYTSKNVGLIQDRLREKGRNFGDRDLEDPSDYLIKVFEEEGKLLDEEAKSLNINIKDFPKEEDALSEFEEIINNFDINTIKENLLDFEKKYCTLGVYIGMSYVFVNHDSDPKFTAKGRIMEYIEGDDEFRSSFSINSFRKEELMKMVKNKSKYSIFSNLEITLNLKSDDKYHKYNINV